MQDIRKQRIRLAISVIILVALMVLTYVLIFRNHEIEQILGSLAALRARWIAGGAVMVLVYIVTQAFALQIPLRAFGQHISLWRSVRYVLIGAYFSAITPSSTGGQPMQLYYMASDGLGVNYSTLTLLTANISYQIVVIAYGVVMLAVRRSFVTESVNLMKAFIIYGYIIAILLLGMLVLVLYSTPVAERVIVFVIRVLVKLRIIKNPQIVYEQAERQINEYKSSVKLLREKPGVFYSVLLFTIVGVTAMYAIPFFIYRAFGLSAYSLLDLLAVQAILFIAVAYMPVPGSVGVSEKGFMSLFHIFFPPGMLVSAMLIFRGLTYYLLLIFGGVTVILVQVGKARRKQTAGTPQEPDNPQS